MAILNLSNRKNFSASSNSFNGSHADLIALDALKIYFLFPFYDQFTCKTIDIADADRKNFRLPINDVDKKLTYIFSGSLQSVLCEEVGKLIRLLSKNLYSNHRQKDSAYNIIKLQLMMIESLGVSDAFRSSELDHEGSKTNRHSMANCFFNSIAITANTEHHYEKLTVETQSGLIKLVFRHIEAELQENSYFDKFFFKNLLKFDDLSHVKFVASLGGIYGKRMQIEQHEFIKENIRQFHVEENTDAIYSLVKKFKLDNSDLASFIKSEFGPNYTKLRSAKYKEELDRILNSNLANGEQKKEAVYGNTFSTFSTTEIKRESGQDVVRRIGAKFKFE